MAPGTAGYERVAVAIGASEVCPEPALWGDPSGRYVGTDMLAYMVRTTVKLPEDLDARLRHEAQRRGKTISEVTREAIEAHLGGRSGRRRFRAAGAGASGRTDISERVEEILAAEFGSSR